MRSNSINEILTYLLQYMFTKPSLSLSIHSYIATSNDKQSFLLASSILSYKKKEIFFLLPPDLFIDENKQSKIILFDFSYANQ